MLFTAYIVPVLGFALPGSLVGEQGHMTPSGQRVVIQSDVFTSCWSISVLVSCSPKQSLHRLLYEPDPGDMSRFPNWSGVNMQHERRRNLRRGRGLLPRHDPAILPVLSLTSQLPVYSNTPAFVCYLFLFPFLAPIASCCLITYCLFVVNYVW